MKIIDPGHCYALQDNKQETHTNGLQFFKDGNINNCEDQPGTTNQETLRALIDRVWFLNEQEPNPINHKIVKHLRMALVLHEIRHLERLVDKGQPVEEIPITKTGHFV